MIDFRRLIKAGVHFGHLTSRVFPGMKKYIWGQKDGTHLIDVSKTAFYLERASKFLEGVASEGKTILWVGTKKSAQQVVEAAAKETEMPYVNHRWIGGSLSNFSQIKKSLTKLGHNEDILKKAEKYPHYTKKEFNTLQKVTDRLLKNVGGIRELRWPIGAIVLVDVDKEFSALREANRLGIPVVALVDTNGNPSNVDFVIPGNDDRKESVELVIDYLKDAVLRGKVVAKTNADAVQEQEIESIQETAGLLQLEQTMAEEEALSKKAKTGGVAKTVVAKKPVAGNKKRSFDRDESGQATARKKFSPEKRDKE